MSLLPVLVLVLVLGILAGFLKSLDYQELRYHPRGLVSERGLLLIVGGGFAVGFVYGAATAGGGDFTWLFRGLTVGAIVAAGGAFYLGSQQRSDRRRRKESGEKSEENLGENLGEGTKRNDLPPDDSDAAQ